MQVHQTSGMGSYDFAGPNVCVLFDPAIPVRFPSKQHRTLHVAHANLSYVGPATSLTFSGRFVGFAILLRHASANRAGYTQALFFRGLWQHAREERLCCRLNNICCRQQINFPVHAMPRLLYKQNLRPGRPPQQHFQQGYEQ